MKTHNSFCFQSLEPKGKNLHINNSDYYFEHSNKPIPKSKSLQKNHKEKIGGDIKKNEIDFSEEILRSMFSVDVHSITKQKREIKSATTNKRKLRVYPKELIPIPKIEPQKSYSNISPDKVIIQQRPLTSTMSLRHSLIDPTTRSANCKRMSQDYQKTNENDCLTITQLDSTIRQKSPISKNEFLPMIHVHKRPSTTNYGRRMTSKKSKSSETHPATTEQKTHDVTPQNDIQSKDPVKQEKHITFDKKSFIEKLNEVSLIEPHSKSNIAFSNGRVLSSLHYAKEPDRYVLACAIHIQFSFNFFTFATDPPMVKYLTIDEESYDLFDPQYESSNRIRRCSKYMQLANELFGSFENPLLQFFNVVPSLVRKDIEKQHLIDQAKNIPSLANQNSLSLSLRTDAIKKHYQDMKTSDTSHFLIQQERDLILDLNDDVIDEIDGEENDENLNMSLSKLNYLLPDLD